MASAFPRLCLPYFDAVVVGDAESTVPNAIAAHWSILGQDLRYTVRSLKGSRGFALATILVTALGVGANVDPMSALRAD